MSPHPEINHPTRAFKTNRNIVLTNKILDSVTNFTEILINIINNRKRINSFTYLISMIPYIPNKN